ncbi:MAG TPA: hypothetical protein VIL13_04725 [Longimicrobiales bacterium]
MGRTASLVVGLMLMLGARPGVAQRLLDWPIRTSGGAEAVVSGAAAVFWNPAGVGLVEGRIEGLVADIEGPASTGLGGVALAVAWQPGGRVAVALGYHHIGIDGIPRTSTSPIPDGTDAELDVGEDLVALAAAYELAPGWTAGVLARYWWANQGNLGIQAAFGAGVIYRPRLPLRPIVAAAAVTDPTGVRWMSGLEASLPTPPGAWRAGVSYGLAGGGWRGAGHLTHRLALLAHWREWLTVTAGFALDPAAESASPEPVVTGELRLGRYTIGITREDLANGLGAAYTYRLNVTL